MTIIYFYSHIYYLDLLLVIDIHPLVERVQNTEDDIITATVVIIYLKLKIRRIQDE